MPWKKYNVCAKIDTEMFSFLLVSYGAERRSMQKETKTEVYQAADDFLMSPKVDFCFKELFQSPKVRQGFLAAILGKNPEEIAETQLMQTILSKESADSKYGILDVRVLMTDGSQVDLEMQVAPGYRFCSGTKRNRGERILLLQKVNAIFLIYIYKALDSLIDGVGVQILFHDPDLCVTFFQKVLCQQCTALIIIRNNTVYRKMPHGSGNLIKHYNRYASLLQKLVQIIMPAGWEHDNSGKVL